jgi:2-polyprenyl-6-methoxyphenol hydroxylase-like FAD-dependent oxidoreductase
VTASPWMRLRVLISGGGIAGATLACLLGRAGHHVTVVERDHGLRSSGSPVDVRRPAFGVMEDLGLVTALSDYATTVRRLVLGDDAGRPIASMPTRRSRDREREIPRSALTPVLVDEARKTTDIRFGDSIRKLEADERGVDVTFGDAPSERFDLVVGADGLHSLVRRLAFGPESDYLTHLGLYVATVSLPGPADGADTIVMHNEPGAAAAVHPSTGSPIAILIFRSSIWIDPRDAQAAKRLVSETYREVGWRAPEILATYCRASDSYFDAISRIRVPEWTHGRVTLLGDAASCVSLFGEGSSSAIVGASTLARSIASFGQDIPLALARYEATHRPVTEHGQRMVPFASHILIPASATGIKLRNRLLRLAQATLKSQFPR